MNSKGNLYNKVERIVSRKLIDQLFVKGNSQSASAFPLRIVYMQKERQEGEPPVKVLVSVSKRHFKRAVRRNRAKRQVREAYRLQKNLLTEKVPEHLSIAAAFIWLSDTPCDSRQVSRSMRKLLEKVAEDL